MYLSLRRGSQLRVLSPAHGHGFSTPIFELETAAAQDKAIQERAAFEDRLRQAEEITRAESGTISTVDVRISQSTALPTTESPAPPATSKRWWR